MPPLHLQVPFPPVKSLCLLVISFPRRGKIPLDGPEKFPAVQEFIRHMERVLGHCRPSPAARRQSQRLLKFPLQGIDRRKAFKVIDNVKNNRLFSLPPAGGKGAPDLLQIKRRRNGRPQQNHTVHALHMHAFIEHVNAV